MGVNASAPWGWARIIDVTDEKYPLQISTIKLAASEAQHGAQTVRSRPDTGHIWFNSLFDGFMIAEVVDNPLRRATASTGH